MPARAASCLSVGKPPLHPITIAYTAYRCPRVKTHPRHVWPPRETKSGQGLATRWEVAGAQRLVRGTARCNPEEAKVEGSQLRVGRKGAPHYKRGESM